MIKLKAFDIEDNNLKDIEKNIIIKKVSKRFNEYNDKRIFKNDEN
jgi:hypothetical protein